MTLPEIHDVVDGMAEVGTDDYQAAVVLLASTEVGPNIVRLSAFTRIGRGKIRVWSRRWRENGVWVDGKVYHNGWDDPDPKMSSVAFMLDVLVGTGALKRVTGESK